MTYTRGRLSALLSVLTLTCLLGLVAAAGRAEAAVGSFEDTTYNWIATSALSTVYSFEASDMVDANSSVDSDDGFANVNGNKDIIWPFIAFPFYSDISNGYSIFYVNANGWLSFNYDGSLRQAPDGFPSPNMGGAIIAPLLADLVMDSGSSIICGRLIASNAYAVTWQAFRQKGYPSGPTSSFQVVLHQDGRIDFNYRHVGITGPFVIGINRGDYLFGYQRSGSLPADQTSIFTYTPEPSGVPVFRLAEQPASLTRLRYIRLNGFTDFMTSLAFSCNGTRGNLTFQSNDSGRSFQTPTVSLSEGLNSIVISGSKNSQTLTSEYTIRLDTLRPTTAFVYPAANSYQKAPFRFLADSRDSNSGIKSVTLQANGKNVLTMYKPISGIRYGLTVSLSTDGKKTLKLISVDKAGNTASYTRVVYLDRYKPLLSSFSAPLSIRRGGQAVAYCRVKESFATTVRLWLFVYRDGKLVKTVDSGGFNRSASTAAPRTGLVWNGRTSSGAVAPAGRYKLVFSARDRAGSFQFAKLTGYLTVK